jgi:hypothetical protein
MNVALETEKGALTSMDVKALKQCNQVSVSHRGKARYGEGTLRCVKKLEQKGPFDPDERVHLIECESTVRCYKGDSEGIEQFSGDENFRCNELLFNYTSSVTEIGSLAEILRVDDVISLKWIGSHNGYTREAGLHMDSLNVEIKRGSKRLTFCISNHTCPDNTARMIQRGWSS